MGPRSASFRSTLWPGNTLPKATVTPPPRQYTRPRVSEPFSIYEDRGLQPPEDSPENYKELFALRGGDVRENFFKNRDGTWNDTSIDVFLDIAQRAANRRTAARKPLSEHALFGRNVHNTYRGGQSRVRSPRGSRKRRSKVKRSKARRSPY